MAKTMWLTFSSSIEQLCEINESFDRGIMRVCYTGKNRNGSNISKKAIENAIPSMYNCPIVCNYNVVDDTIGGHDMDVVNTDNGLKLVNLTDAVGVVPYGAQYYWESVDDGDAIHDYFCVEVILWKRAAAYQKIKSDGIVAQSMEISVKDGRMVDGCYAIKRFIFTAFCLLGDDVEPCFESASLEMYNLQSVKEKFSKMIEDVKNNYSSVASSDEVNKYTKLFMKGGEEVEGKIAILSEFGLTIDDIEFSILDMSEDELRNKLTEMKKFDGEGDGEGGDDPSGEDPSNDDPTNEDPADSSGDNTDDPTDDPNAGTGTDTPGENAGGSGSNEEGSGSGNGSSDSSGDDAGSDTSGTDNSSAETPSSPVVVDDGDDDTAKKPSNHTYGLLAQETVIALNAASDDQVYTDPYYGEMRRYTYVDHDPDALEVIFMDWEECKLYGFKYSFNGDNAVIDWDSRTRKRFTIVDYDEGDKDFAGEFVLSSANIVSQKEIERSRRLDNLFSEFSSMDGNEAFEALKNDNKNMSVEDVENKCFEIKGRCSFSLNSKQDKPTRIGVDYTEFYNKNDKNERYGDLFDIYGSTN